MSALLCYNQRVENVTRAHPIADLRPTLVYFSMAVLAIIAGVILRFIPTGLPYYVTKYGGSGLWAAMIFCLIAAIFPHRKTMTLAAAALSFTALSEFFRLYHKPTLDAFRLTLAGALLLGRVFDPWHLVAYAVAILIVVAIDSLVIRRWLHN